MKLHTFMSTVHASWKDTERAEPPYMPAGPSSNSTPELRRSYNESFVSNRCEFQRRSSIFQKDACKGSQETLRETHVTTARQPSLRGPMLFADFWNLEPSLQISV